MWLWLMVVMILMADWWQLANNPSIFGSILPLVIFSKKHQTHSIYFLSRHGRPAYSYHPSDLFIMSLCVCPKEFENNKGNRNQRYHQAYEANFKTGGAPGWLLFQTLLPFSLLSQKLQYLLFKLSSFFLSLPPCRSPNKILVVHLWVEMWIKGRQLIHAFCPCVDLLFISFSFCPSDLCYDRCHFCPQLDSNVHNLHWFCLYMSLCWDYQRSNNVFWLFFQWKLSLLSSSI